MTWKPRSSKGGLYSICAYAAWLDRERAEKGLVIADADDSTSAYADLGTLIHDRLQRRLGCVMQERLFENLEACRTNAATLFKGAEDLEAAISSAVEFAVTIFPASPDGKPWLAEPDGELANLTGHLDFESQDGDDIIDLKTTSRKPDNARMKPLHLAQVVQYWDLRGRRAQRARILYLDSLKGSWAVMTAPVDLTSPFVQEYADRLSEARTASMTRTTPPLMAPGEHCKSGFCSYRNSRACYNSLIPPGEASTIHENSERAKPSEFAVKAKKVKLWD